MQVVTKLYPDSVVFLLLATVSIALLLLCCHHHHQHYHHQQWKFLLLKSGFDQYKFFWHNFLILHCHHIRKC